ncbi:MAG: ABC transporter ATP-binding protein [Dictyoglomus sp.]|jgi:ATP-binding cassette subfamily B protein|uniref:ABC transporter ATP-binding protein n=1 Tax=Dictyoglomus sp. TaxID=28205 RepID=UPI000CCF7B82|nr:MAG: multidrug ABC transporter ATP-binding protein [Dictyoglomus turgidum]PNV78741.1 MAG: multidrug ABC transporter ATP-binding protein [Dictyoglomus turgidum]PNV79707.1 MAG: multidrug ABC transporter ATP-binding protein [Dictyoglomus turgidum]PNV80080.1 MAG: multidrug ABC transporter ATP-binding protein [Dictyoglomus turgidum]
MPYSLREDEKLEEKISIDILRRLFRYLKPYKKEILIVLFFIFVVMTVDLANPYLMKIAIDRFIKNKDPKGLITVGFIVLLLNLISALCAKKRTERIAKITHRIILNIRQDLFNHVQKLSFAFFDERPVGKILARIIGDVNSLTNLFNMSVTNLIPDTFTIIATATIMFYLNAKLASYGLLMFPFLLITLFSIQTISRRRWQLVRKKNSTLNAFTHENYSGIRIIKYFNAENYRKNIFTELAWDVRQAFVRAVRINDLFWPMVEFSWGVGSIITFYFGIKMIKSGSITVGLLIAFSNYIAMFWRPIMNLSNFYNNLVTSMASAERIFEIMDINPNIVEDEEAVELDIKGEVEFKNVSFSYDGKKKVLEKVSFKVYPGERIALVGHTGAGKTTIVNLICRFYDPDEGEILIDGVDIRKIKLESLRRQVAVMFQDTFLFSGSIMENIRYGRLSASDEEVINTAREVYAHDFVVSLEKGYDTRVQERGLRLSTGQRQLVSLARTLIANPKILILDEATASIDTHTERLLQKGIEKLLQGRTSFIIAHRLSTIQNADRIFVIENGKIVEEGNHEELMKKRGIYYNMFISQFKLWSEEKEIVS